MNTSDIAKYRLENQILNDNFFHNAKDLLNHFGAMQAQDYAMAKWAIGLRTAQNKIIPI